MPQSVPAVAAELAQAAAALAHWRDSTPVGARIPEALWSRAAELAATHGVAKVAATPKAATAVLHIFLRVVEAHLRKICPGASAQAHFGAVSFVHRFGASLNRHIHYHCCIFDGLFDPLQAGGVQFRHASALAPEEVAVIEQQVRRRVLRWFSRHGLLDPDDARDMLAGTEGGFSLDASVCIAGHDRAGLGSGCYATVHARRSPLSASSRSPRATGNSRSSIVSSSPGATDAPHYPSPRWRSSTTSPPCLHHRSWPPPSTGATRT